MEQRRGERGVWSAKLLANCNIACPAQHYCTQIPGWTPETSLSCHLCHARRPGGLEARRISASLLSFHDNPVPCALSNVSADVGLLSAPLYPALAMRWTGHSVRLGNTQHYSHVDWRGNKSKLTIINLLHQPLVTVTQYNSQYIVINNTLQVCRPHK